MPACKYQLLLSPQKSHPSSDLPILASGMTFRRLPRCKIGERPDSCLHLSAATKKLAAAVVPPSCLSTPPIDAHAPLLEKPVAAPAVPARALRSLELVALREPRLGITATAPSEFAEYFIFKATPPCPVLSCLLTSEEKQVELSGIQDVFPSAKVEVASWKWDSYIRRQTQGLTGINQRCEGVLPIVAKIIWCSPQTFSNMIPNCIKHKFIAKNL
ncbi:hypothetical protein PSTT_04367 [Puccinia striiformis]|uniref:Uncharacterized protein n=1 Tax=Puccinia striiformis TaxID=27350 RepID=A0A2S4VTD2_9BASI|nr:hypothetical protein PSTT_04367 [Puccinia striiformis]